MKIKLENVYYCHQCKKILPHLESLLFVEDGQSRGFCSESCIEKFYAPLAEYYSQFEKSLREELLLENESCLKFVNDPALIEATLAEPNEVWSLENGLKEELFSFIRHYEAPTREKKVGRFSMIALCYVFGGRPSFIMILTATSDARILEKLRIGKKRTDWENSAQKAMAKEQDFSLLEQKKATLLASLLEFHSKSDIAIDDYPLYDGYIEDTLNAPDEVYAFKDREGDVLHTFIKAHVRSQVSFYYFVICLPSQDETANVYPILCFPSLDGEVYRWCCRGEQLHGTPKN